MAVCLAAYVAVMTTRMKDAGDFTATLTGWPGGSRFAVDMTAQKLRLSDFAGYIDKIPDEFKTLGTVSGHIGINVEESEIANLEADITLQDGVLAASGKTQQSRVSLGGYHWHLCA